MGVAGQVSPALKFFDYKSGFLTQSLPHRNLIFSDETENLLKSISRIRDIVSSIIDAAWHVVAFLGRRFWWSLLSVLFTLLK
jgi:hypothetical protein